MITTYLFMLLNTVSLGIIMALVVLRVAEIKAAHVNTMSFHPAIRTGVQAMYLTKEQGEHSK